jgi:hypothetical protein
MVRFWVLVSVVSLWCRENEEVKLEGSWHVMPLVQCSVDGPMVEQFTRGISIKPLQLDPEQVMSSENGFPNPQSA